MKGIWRRISKHNVTMIAAGVAFYAMLALVPALIAVVAVYALVSDPSKVAEQVAPMVNALPSDVGNLLRDELHGAVAANHGGLTIGLVASLLGTLWAASGGVNALTRGLRIIMDSPLDRGILRRALSVLLTIGALLAAAVALILITVFPVALGHVGLGEAGRLGAEVLRWLLLLVLVVVGLAVLYRLAGGPNDRWRFVSWGVGVAVVVWILGSVGFTLYVSNFGRYNQTYGGLAAVVVLLLWLYLSSFAVLLGAVVDAELTARRAIRTLA